MCLGLSVYIRELQRERESERGGEGEREGAGEGALFKVGYLNEAIQL